MCRLKCQKTFDSLTVCGDDLGQLKTDPAAAASGAARLIKLVFPDCFEVPFEEVKNTARRQEQASQVPHPPREKLVSKKEEKNHSKTYENSQLGFEL